MFSYFDLFVSSLTFGGSQITKDAEGKIFFNYL